MKKKMIAPCVIATLMSLYFLSCVAGLFVAPANIFINGIFVLLFLGSVIVMISVTKERIDEIRSGEEDDLSQY